MSLVWSCNEWDPLEEVVVGNPLRARFPTADVSTQLAEFPDRPLDQIPQGPFPQQIIEMHVPMFLNLVIIKMEQFAPRQQKTKIYDFLTPGSGPLALGKKQLLH